MIMITDYKNITQIKHKARNTLSKKVKIIDINKSKKKNYGFLI